MSAFVHGGPKPFVDNVTVAERGRCCTKLEQPQCPCLNLANKSAISARRYADNGTSLKRTILHKFGLLFPVLSWLFIQFAMSGMMLGSPANAMQIEICSPFGVQQITIDIETGEPIEPAIRGGECDWCQSFGVVADTIGRGADGWIAMGHGYQYMLVLAPPPHKPLRLVADYQSRAPPSLSSHNT